ncbi:cellulose biosynthesis cyclic di-GMP-binding regulatory protein BcsB [Gordonia sp. PP30]|uniref:cellulose biosynthesis cyclic di-GMP-binding regulatory protein BcsB n=1 Tax=Gordonia sp. PP30 TaxID=2935861 RepID=UPI001FFEEFD8|nr:cellulose biosynthesis cyclic di-GMP-binding regulatory protein BcsB [Gordonia sp. PP30]UQE75451.1 cellulose biosynthesis cyclic di-GMP-binding regulatory protein BcsB [Gordonia sp. PP30]
MGRRLAVIVTAFVLFLAGNVPGAAGAAPGDAEQTDTESTGDAQLLRVGLDYLGTSATISLPGVQEVYPLTLAVPNGTRPDAIEGRAQLPASVTGGTVDVLQGDRILSRTAVSTSPNAPIRLPLTGIQVNDETRSVTLSLRTYLRTEGVCEFDPDEGFRITDATMSVTGRPTAPTAISDFLPPVLTGVTLYLPTDPRPDEGAAAVSLATALVAHYGNAPIAVRTRALPRDALRPPAATGPLERQIVIAQSLPEGLHLANDGAYLTLGGDDLRTAAPFLTSGLAPLAMASAAIPGPAADAPQLPRDVSTLADIGVGDQRVTALGWPSVTVGIDQTRLGRPSDDIQVQLRGTYTAPPSGSGGQLTVRSGDTVIATWPADQSGAFDRWVSVPNSVLERFTELRVTLERGDSRTGCGDAFRSSLSLSASGRIRSNRAHPPIPAGLASVPQALMPRTQLAWTRGDITDITRAVSLLSGLQRLSAIPLGVDVVAMSAVNNDLPAVLISGDGTGLPKLSLPVSAAGQGRIDVTGLDGQPAVTTIPQTVFGSLQVVNSGDRTVLVATSTGAPALLDEALAWLDADPARWGSVHGAAMLQAAGRTPVFFGDTTAPAPTSSGTATAWWTGLGVLAAGLLVLGGLLLLRRRRGTSEPDAD